MLRSVMHAPSECRRKVCEEPLPFLPDPQPNLVRHIQPAWERTQRAAVSKGGGWGAAGCVQAGGSFAPSPNFGSTKGGMVSWSGGGQKGVCFRTEYVLCM